VEQLYDQYQANTKPEKSTKDVKPDERGVADVAYNAESNGVKPVKAESKEAVET
jgi:hypothetical protein